MSAKCILVVDDNRSIVKVLELVLTHEGFEVLTAFDGQAALEAVNNRKPDLIILDIEMPEMSGYEVCRRLSLHAATQNIPVIMLTVKGRIEEDRDPSKRDAVRKHVQERIRAFDVGATDFLTKPVIAKDVVTRVKQILAFS